MSQHQNVKLVHAKIFHTPSLSLLRSICYPECHKLHSEATEWGIKHEKITREAYLKKAKVSHSKLVVSDSGFVINPQFRHLGDSPDDYICF